MNRTLIICAAAAVALAGCHRKLPDHTAQSEAFLAQQAKQPGVHVLPDGLEYKVLSSGPATGLKPRLNDLVKVHYEGKLVSGQVFDSSYQRGAPVAMQLKDLIKGWQEALQLMRPGDVWELYVPPKLGYGDQGAGDIPPGSVLIFKIELIDVLPDESRIQQG